MKIVDSEHKIDREELFLMSKKMFGSLVKAVVDISKNIMVVDAEMHVDEEQLLLEKGSKQEHLWGINLYPEQSGDGFIEYDSMINLRPRQGNRTRGVDDPKIRLAIIDVIKQLVVE